MPRVLEYIEGNNNPLRECSLGQEGGVSGGVFDHGTSEEDGLVTWEALSSTKPRYRGEPVTRLRRTARKRAHVSSAHVAQNKRPSRGRPRASGTHRGA